MTTSPNKPYLPLIFLLLFMLSTLVIYANSGEYNNVDENGLKQGYWIIKGYMQPGTDFKADATIEEGLYEDNRKEGLWKRFYSNGNLRSEITYKSNKPFGPYSIYYENGQQEEKGIWHKNKNVGEFARFYENGQPQQSFFFADNGKRNGVQKYFHDNGNLELEVTIQNGKESGVMKRFYPDGTLKEEKSLNDGKLIDGSIKKYKHNTFKEKVEIEAATLPKDSDAVKEVKEETNAAANFRPNGFNTLYNKTGQVTQIGEFKNGRLWNGRWNRYNTDGILIRIEVYKNGKFIGTGVISED
ncbi:MAG: hypothetical protein ACPGED_05485 [Flavobacteriales bacterium]